MNRRVAEVAAIRRGDLEPPELRQGRERPSVETIVDRFLDLHDVDVATTAKLRSQLRHATARFGGLAVDEIDPLDVEAWRKALPDGSRHDVFRAFRQVLSWAIGRGLCEANPTAGIKNPKRKRHERRDVEPFETWEQIDAIAAELDPRSAAIPVFAVGTGLRPEEWIALERRDVDRDAGVVHVRRRFTQGVLKQGGKTDGSTRAVPLRGRVVDVLDAMPRRIDTQLLFPAARGGYIDLERFRHREWTPALRAAGVDHRRIYDCRHTFATWAIEGGMNLIWLAGIMGTSVRQLEDTYARWLRRTDDQVRELFDAYDAALSAAARS